MKKVQIMDFITAITYLHIGKRWRRRTGMHYFVVLNSNPNVEMRVWVGVVCWIAQGVMLMSTILGFLSVVSSMAEGYEIHWILLSAVITGFSAWGLYKLEGIFQKRPSWDKEDYVPTEEEWKDWGNWVHCEEEYQAWGN